MARKYTPASALAYISAVSAGPDVPNKPGPEGGGGSGGGCQGQQPATTFECKPHKDGPGYYCEKVEYYCDGSTGQWKGQVMALDTSQCPDCPPQTGGGFGSIAEDMSW